jgi:hypothetical protein
MSRKLAYHVLLSWIEAFLALPLENLGHDRTMTLARRIVSEGLGRAFLLALLAGSGIMAEYLAIKKGKIKCQKNFPTCRTLSQAS